MFCPDCAVPIYCRNCHEASMTHFEWDWKHNMYMPSASHPCYYREREQLIDAHNYLSEEEAELDGILAEELIDEAVLEKLSGKEWDDLCYPTEYIHAINKRVLMIQREQMSYELLWGLPITQITQAEPCY